MAIDQVYPNPTVKQVVFAVTFPNLFYLESKIGDIQLEIMEHFPESELLFRKHVLFADVGPEGDINEIPAGVRETQGKKIWVFNSPNKYQLNITSGSLDINSNFHKTYQLGDGYKFRDIIEFVVDRFLQVVPVTLFTRMGLRYIDECPIPIKDNENFIRFYNTVFPLDRFNLSDAIGMDFRTLVRRGDSKLRYAESLKKLEDQDDYKLIMDFDGSHDNVSSAEYLPVLDQLHTLISDEFEASIKPPLIDYMMQPGGE